jgi:PAS domain-containing protein
MSEEFPEPTDLRAICSALEHFSLPAALCSIEDNRLVIWNQLFQKASGLSEDELAQTGLSSLILLDET